MPVTAAQIEEFPFGVSVRQTLLDPTRPAILTAVRGDFDESARGDSGIRAYPVKNTPLVADRNITRGYSCQDFGCPKFSRACGGDKGGNYHEIFLEYPPSCRSVHN